MANPKHFGRELAAAIVIFLIGASYLTFYNAAFFIALNEGFDSESEVTASMLKEGESSHKQLSSEQSEQPQKAEEQAVKTKSEQKKAESKSNLAPKTPSHNIPGKYPEASLRPLTDKDLRNLSKRELKIMRNEVFARHGFIFKSADMKNYFGQQSWYKGRYSDVRNKLTDLEYKNVKLIQQYEVRK